MSEDSAHWREIHQMKATLASFGERLARLETQGEERTRSLEGLRKDVSAVRTSVDTMNTMLAEARGARKMAGLGLSLARLVWPLVTGAVVWAYYNLPNLANLLTP